MDEERLIMLVSYHEEIYNSSNPQYNNLEKKEMCWRRIAEVLGQPVYKCKDKWANLRGSYRRATKKRIAAHLQGAESIPTWRFESQMEFLRPFIKPREYLSIKDGSEVKHEQDGCIYFDSALEYSDTEMLPAAEKISSTTAPMTHTASSNTNDGHDSSKRRDSCCYGESIDGSATPRSSTTTSESERDKDVTLEFFINMANTVKTFPSKLQAEVKFKVFQLVNAAEYSVCQNHQNSTGNHSEPTKSRKHVTPPHQSTIRTPPYQNESLNSTSLSSTQ